jgi:hypothetical protein
MNAPIADQIKVEAAKSLLERMAEKTKLVRFFRYNASAKHGVPIDSDDTSISFSDPPPKPAEPEPKPVEPQPQPQPIVVESVIKCKDNEPDKTKGILQTLVAIAALVAAAWGGNKLAQLNNTPQMDLQTMQQPYQESPFQFLEDQGEHLP